MCIRDRSDFVADVVVSIISPILPMMLSIFSLLSSRYFSIDGRINCCCCAYFGWARLKSRLLEIDCKARQLNRKTRPVAYCLHIGNAVYVTANDRFHCMDIRCWILLRGLEPGRQRTTRRGISLNLQEWWVGLDLVPS